MLYQIIFPNTALASTCSSRANSSVEVAHLFGAKVTKVGHGKRRNQLKHSLWLLV